MVVPEARPQRRLHLLSREIAAGRCPARLVEEEQRPAARPRPAEAGLEARQPLPDGVTAEALPAALIAKLSPSPAGHQYMRVDNDILIVSLGARNVAALVADLSRL